MRSDDALIVRLEDAHVLHIGGINGKPMALGGVVRGDGRAFVLFNLLGDCAAFGAPMLWAMKRMIRRQPPPLYALCNEAKYPQAPRLLTWLGFSPTDEIMIGARVWAILH